MTTRKTFFLCVAIGFLAAKTPETFAADSATPPAALNAAAVPAAPAAKTEIQTPKAARHIRLPRPRPVTLDVQGKAGSSEDEALPVVDTDEAIALPPYPPDAQVAAGKAEIYNMGDEDTLLDVARHFRLGFVELRAANPAVDPWTPVPGEEVVIPAFKLLPRAPQKGIVVNLAQMRMYYFRGPKHAPYTFPIGIGREGLQTPTGETTIINKVAGPSWFPTDRMREEKPFLPAAVPPGPSNPLGTHALYLGWPTFLIHGSNKPWAIGRRVSSGCMRMYPEDIKLLYQMVPVGTKVTVVDQPILVGWVGDTLYLEANPSKSQSIDIEINGEHAVKELTDGVKKVIVDAAGSGADRINWDMVKKVMEERLGYPVAIASMKEDIEAPVSKPAATTTRNNYN